jgi:hypothetical protein
MTATMAGLGAFVFTFGFFFLIYSPNWVYVFTGNSYDQPPVVWAQLIGLVLTSLGAAVLVFGILSKPAATAA